LIQKLMPGSQTCTKYSRSKYKYSKSVLKSSGVARNLIWGVYVLTSHCYFKTCVNMSHT